ncbi:MAG: TAT-variant-translocated molybdopterin oxidoreductase [Flavobacteriales bacterium]|nr:TAT-variant-translocated molybdopterin oxidoreductase [Flavobacteriales bacterium]
MANTKKYWKGLEQLNEDPNFLASTKNEFPEDIPVDEFLGDADSLENSSTTRRDFLKFLGFGIAAASLAACETPVTKAIPYLNKPEEVTPGVANFYASTYYDGNDYAPILVKTREGRPIFISGNTSSTLTKGAVNARINSSVLSLYDNNRLKSPLVNGKESDWTTVDKTIKNELTGAKNIRVLSSTIISEATKQIINDFTGVKTVEEDVEQKEVLVQYNPISYSGILNANKESFGKKAIPTYNFKKAKTIVSVGADFMGNWLDSLMYVNDYAQTRKPDNDWMSKHYQIEANMSLSGTNADVRIPVKPSEYGAVLAQLYSKLGGGISASDTKYDTYISAIAKDLKSSKGESIVVCGSNDKNVQIIVNAINSLLGNYGKTIDLNRHSNTKQGDDFALNALIAEMNAGEVDALFIYGVDPVFTLGDTFKSALAKVKLTVSFATKLNDTASACKFVCPDNHALESWNDANPVNGYYSLGQPTISKLFNTRQAQESFLTWAGNTTSYYDYLRTYWEKNIFTKQSSQLFFADFWNKILHDGVVEFPIESIEVIPFNGNVSAAYNEIKTVKGGDLEIELTQNTGIGDGVGADNPWLQEMPDPITKVTWDNYVTMHPVEMEAKGYNTRLGQEEAMNVVNVTVNGQTVENLPVVPQPGQAKGTIGLALGYGKKVGNQKEIVGKNAYPLVASTEKGISYYGVATLANVETDQPYKIACTQVHQTIMGRDSIIRETTFDVFKNGKKEDYNPAHTLLAHENGETVEKLTKEFNIWEKDQPVENIGHRWGMSIDLNTCIGCSACVTSCIAENNIPVIGKDEVRRARIMHWMRIDRYYASNYQDAGDIAGTLDKTKEATGKGTTFSYQEMETPADNPMVVHQPMMCQHCNHAGCETVCPVAATTHSNEGLNMMAYNRCIGTRYCANNCAYKVRRFNWYNYTGYKKFTDINPSQDDLGRLVLNPDVVVRARGVMEKCSMCVQQIQAGKLEAKKAGTKVVDGSIQTACSTACPTNAITFGDLNDKESLVRTGMDNDRSYRVIEEKGQEPNIYYQTKVRNLKSSKVESKNHHS